MILSLVLSLLSSNAQAASIQEDALRSATANYRQVYQAERNMPAPEPLGFSLSIWPHDVMATVFSVADGKLSAFESACHYHGTDMDCHERSSAELGEYTRSSAMYSVTEMEKALGLAADFLAQTVPGAILRKADLWEAQKNIRFVLGFEKDGQAQEIFVGCHYHGAEMDCHRKRDAGPGRPALKQ